MSHNRRPWTAEFRVGSFKNTRTVSVTKLPRLTPTGSPPKRRGSGTSPLADFKTASIISRPARSLTAHASKLPRRVTKTLDLTESKQAVSSFPTYDSQLTSNASPTNESCRTKGDKTVASHSQDKLKSKIPRRSQKCKETIPSSTKRLTVKSASKIPIPRIEARTPLPAINKDITEHKVEQKTSEQKGSSSDGKPPKKSNRKSKKIEKKKSGEEKSVRVDHKSQSTDAHISSLVVKTHDIPQSVVNNTSNNTKDMARRSLKHGKAFKEINIDLLPSKCSLDLLKHEQRKLPGKAVEKYKKGSGTMDTVFQEFKELLGNLIDIEGKITKCPSLFTSDMTHMDKMKLLVSEMKRSLTVLEDQFGGVKSIEYKSIQGTDSTLLCQGQMKAEPLNTGSEISKDYNMNVKQCLDRKISTEDSKVEITDDLNFFPKDKESCNCKKLSVINETIRKNLANRDREIKNLRKDMKKRARCPINVIDEYTRLKNERHAKDMQIAEITAQVNELARKRVNLDATNQNLKNQVEQLKIQVKDLGGEVPVFRDFEIKKGKFRFGRTISPLRISREIGSKGNLEENQDESDDEEDDKTHEEVVNDRNAEHERRKLNESDTMGLKTGVRSSKDMSALLRDVSERLEGNTNELNLTPNSPKAIRFYFNSDCVSKEIGILQRQFTVSTVKNATAKGSGLVYKHISNKKIKQTSKKNKIKNLMKSNKNKRQITRILEDDEEMDVGSEQESLDEHDVLGDVLLLLRR